MNQVKFIGWADAHYDELASKCVTLEDTAVVEQALFDRAIEGKFDFTIFLGDRFLRREPKDLVKVIADRVIYEKVHNGNIPYLNLVGNHDYTENHRRHHTSESIKIFNNVHVMDEAKTYTAIPGVKVHALPADFELDMKNYDLKDHSSLNIFAFHDTVKGSFMDEEHKMYFSKGLDLENFDIPQIDIVLAGDIHVRQKFDLKHTVGGYLGSLTQRTRADAGQGRGWTEVTATRHNANSAWVFDIKFVPSKNLFTRLSFGLNSNTELKDLVFDEKDFTDQFVEIKLVGNKANVDRVADDKCWSKIEKRYKPRRIEIIRSYETEQSNVVVDLSSSTGILDDLDIYLNSKFASLGNLKAEKVADVVRRLNRK